MRQQNKLAGLILLVWMGLIIAVFILIMIPAESSLAQVLPSAFWDLRSLIYSFFYSPSVYE